MNFPAAARPLPKLLLLILLAACEPRGAHDVVQLRGAAMGAAYAVTVVDAPAAMDEPGLRGEVEIIVAAIDRRFSTYRADSELSALNRAAGGDWIEVHPELLAVLAAGQEISRRSGGAFDMTVKPLTDLWGFGSPLPGAGRVPAVREIAVARQAVGHGKFACRRSPAAIRKAGARVSFDVNGIVPGHAADRVAERLEKLGISNYYVDLGGEMRVRGHNGAGRPWTIGIEQPVAGPAQPAWVVELAKGALSTSGNYRNFFEVSGRRYSHMIDPRSGYPVRHALVSVSVVAESALDADAWSTALLVLGPEAGPALAQKLGLGAMFVSRAGDDLEVLTTPGFPRLGHRGKPS